MSDSVAIVRGPNRMVLIVQRRKILRALTRVKLNLSHKLVILKWLATKQDVTAGSQIETALTAANALVGIW